MEDEKDYEELDFKMYITKDKGDTPLIVLEFAGIKTMKQAESLAEEVYKALVPDEEETKVIN